MPAVPPQGPVQLVRFTLYDAGIYPREVHAQKNRIIISVEDRAGGDSELVLERETGGAPEGVGRVHRTAEGRRGRAEFRLGPGRYIVYDSARPANRALLIVEP